MQSKTLWWPFLIENKWRVTVAIALGMLTSYCTLLLPLSIGKYMEIVFATGGGKTRALQLLGISLPNLLPVFFIFFSILLVVKFFSSWAQRYAASLLGESFVASLRQGLFEHQLQQQKESPASVSKAALLLPYSNDSKMMQQLLIKGIIDLVKDVLFMGMGLYVLFLLQPLLTSVVVILMVCFYLLQRWYNLHHKKVFAEKRRNQGALLNYVSQIIITGEQNNENASEIFERKTKKLKSSLTKYHAKKTMLLALTPFMLYLMLAVIMAVMVWGIGPGQLNAGDVITYILLLMTLFPSIRNIIRVEHTWVQGNLSARKFYVIRENSAKKQEMAADTSKKIINNSCSLLHSGARRQQ